MYGNKLYYRAGSFSQTTNRHIHIVRGQKVADFGVGKETLDNLLVEFDRGVFRSRSEMMPIINRSAAVLGGAADLCR
jgi:hypothetical protein